MGLGGTDLAVDEDFTAKACFGASSGAPTAVVGAGRAPRSGINPGLDRNR